jgi:DNA-directed RNA polymerase specialized sigma24 family protein
VTRPLERDAGAPARAGADTVLERDYERLKPEILRTVRGKLAARGIRFDNADLEAFYNQAWHGIHVKLAAGEEVDNLAGLLVTISQRRALDEYRAMHTERRADPAELGTVRVDLDLAARVDDQTRLRQFIEGMRERLDQREREAAVLCYVQDYSRGEAALALGIKPRRMEKIMDGVSKKVGLFVRDIERDEWCESRRSLIKAYALGLLEEDGPRYRLAAEHLSECSACRSDVLRVRGIAALGPPAPLALALLAGAGGGAAAGGHALAHAGHAAGGGAKVAGLTAAGAAGVAATAVIAVSVFNGGPSSPAPLPPPRAAATVAPTVVATPFVTVAPVATAAAPRAAHTHKARRHKRAKPRVVATVVPARAAEPTVAPARTAVPVVAAAKKVSHDGAGEFELR